MLIKISVPTETWSAVRIYGNFYWYVYLRLPTLRVQHLIWRFYVSMNDFEYICRTISVKYLLKLINFIKFILPLQKYLSPFSIQYCFIYSNTTMTSLLRRCYSYKHFNLRTKKCTTTDIIVFLITFTTCRYLYNK